MEKKHLLVLTLILGFFANGVFVCGATYEYSVQEDSLYKYEIKTFDAALADQVFKDNDGIEDLLGDGAEVGAMKARMMTNIIEVDDLISKKDGVTKVEGWEIDMWIWTAEWTTNEEDFEDPEVSKISKINSMDLYKNPEDWGTISGWGGLVVLLTITFAGCPNPAADYLAGLDWSGVDIEGTSIVTEYEANDFANVDIDYDYSIMFNSNGVFKGYKAQTEDGSLIYEVGLQSAIPGYELPIFLGLTALSAIGLIYWTRKRMT